MKPQFVQPVSRRQRYLIRQCAVNFTATVRSGHAGLFIRTYSLSQKNPPVRLSEFFSFFTNGEECLIYVLHTYYTFLCTLDYIFCAIISNFDGVMPYYARLPSLPNVCKMSKTRAFRRLRESLIALLIVVCGTSL